MASFIELLIVGATILIIVEFSVFVSVYISLSSENEVHSFADLIKNSRYRLFWLPKVALGIVQIFSFIFAGNFYKNENGEGIMPAIFCIFVLILYSVVSLFESIRSFRQGD